MTKKKWILIRITREVHKELKSLGRKDETFDEIIKGLIPKPPSSIESDFSQIKMFKIELASGIRGEYYKSVYQKYQELIDKYKDHKWHCSQCGNNWHKLEIPKFCPRCKVKNWNQPIIRDIETEAEIHTKEESG